MARGVGVFIVFRSAFDGLLFYFTSRDAMGFFFLGGWWDGIVRIIHSHWTKMETEDGVSCCGLVSFTSMEGRGDDMGDKIDG